MMAIESGTAHAGTSALSRDDPVALSSVKVGMITFLASEVAFFGTLVMAYVYFLRQTTHGEPNPSQVFRMPLVLIASACLFSSSATILLARARSRAQRPAGVSWLVGLDDRPGRGVSRGHGARVDRVDWHLGLDHEPESVRDHVLYAGRFSRAACDRRPDRDECRAGTGAAAAHHGPKPR